MDTNLIILISTYIVSAIIYLFLCLKTNALEPEEKAIFIILIGFPLANVIFFSSIVLVAFYRNKISFKNKE